VEVVTVASSARDAVPDVPVLSSRAAIGPVDLRRPGGRCVAGAAAAAL